MLAVKEGLFNVVSTPLFKLRESVASQVDLNYLCSTQLALFIFSIYPPIQNIHPSRLVPGRFFTKVLRPERERIDGHIPTGRGHTFDIFAEE